MKKLACGILFIAACSKAEGRDDSKPAVDKPSAPEPAAKVEPPLAAPAGGAAASSTDKLADGFDGKPEITWQGVTLGVYQKGDTFVVRASGVDVTKPISAGDTAQLVENPAGEVALIVRTLVGSDEGGASLAYDLVKLVWDQGKPVEWATWSCDETEAKAGCELPYWADAKGSTAVADPLEHGIDRAWRDSSEDCKSTLTAAETTYQQKYIQLCRDALTRVFSCADDPLFQKETPMTGVERIDPTQISAKHVGETCKQLAHDEMCGLVYGTDQHFIGGPGPRELRAILSASDCAGVSGAFSGPFGENTSEGY